ncbi:MAG: biotin synthase BioB [Thermodesulfobacteriota bacterium]|nr:biotin synthase BioB [Thermodesulfobacteriota bacterium]
MKVFDFLRGLTDKVLKDKDITYGEAYRLFDITKQEDIVTLIGFANSIRQEFKGSVINLCAIINAKSGKCSEDCSFCSQSAHYKTQIETYPLLNREDIIKGAKEALSMGAKRFSIVISGESIKNHDELQSVCEAITYMSLNTQIGRCASLGILTKDMAGELKKAGLQRYHHNLETARSFFSNICTTHSYNDRVDTVRIAKQEGFQVCSGGIFGLGETSKQRLELAFELRELAVDSIPLNFLNPIPNTPLENAAPIPPMEILKTIAMFRFVHPKRDIRICGGRERNLRDVQSLVYFAGANGVMIGNYLTTTGSDAKRDLQLIEDLMLNWR